MMKTSEENNAAMADVAIVPAIPPDAKKIWNIYKVGRVASQACAELGITPSDVWEHIIGDKPVYKQVVQWENRILYPSEEQQVIVAVQKSNNTVLGVVCPNVVDETRYLSKLYVARRAQGLGIASKLIEAALVWHQFNPVTLKVAAYNYHAQEVYEKHGFETISELACGYMIGDKPVPQNVMVKPGHKELLDNANWNLS